MALSVSCVLLYACVGLVTSSVYVRQPYGVLQCRDHCLRLPGCSTYRLDPVQLSCKCCTNETDQCTSKSQIVQTRTKGLRDVKVISTEEDTYIREGLPLLLLAPRRISRERNLIQVFLHNLTIQRIPFALPLSTRITSIVYVRSVGRVLLATDTYLLSIQLLQSKHTVVKEKVKIGRMAVDNNKISLFYISKSDNNVYKSRIRSNQKKIIDDIKKLVNCSPYRCYGVAVDTESELLYISFNTRTLLRSDYSGRKETLLMVHKVGTHLVVDSSRRLLYYHYTGKIFKYSLVRASSTCIQLPYLAVDVTFYRGEVYMVSRLHGYVGVVEGGHYHGLVNVTFKCARQGFRVCGIN